MISVIKSSRLLKIFMALAASAAMAVLTSAHEGHGPAKDESPDGASILKVDDAGVSPEWLAKARADYPLDTCVVSGDRFDGEDMGKPQDYVYRQEGQPDRLLRFCCKDCINDFKKDPLRYLKIVHQASEAKAKSSK